MKALLNDEGWKIWGYVFPDSEVPIKGISSFKARIRKKGEMKCYLVDWAALSDDQRDLILNHLKDRFHDSRDAVEAEILKKGLPLRACLVSSVSIPARFF